MSLRITGIVVFIAVAVFPAIAEVKESVKQTCGVQATKNTYPWMVGVEFSLEDLPPLLKENNVRSNNIKCSVTLIGERHVVSPAHCYAGHLFQMQSKAVILGTLNLICTEVDDIRKCTYVGTMRVPIEKIVTHPKYIHVLKRTLAQTPAYDIAVIILRDAVPYTDLIRPICLPSIDITSSATTDLDLSVVGFPRISRNFIIGDNNPLIHKESFNYVYREECLKTTAISIPQDELCVRDRDGIMVISCMLSGAPLMNKKGESYELIGLLNLGDGKCGGNSSNKTELFTNLFHNLDWNSTSM